MYPSQQNATDQTANFFWLLALIFGAALAVWWLAPKYIVAPIFWFRGHEIMLITDLVSAWDKIAGFLHLPVPSTHALQNLHNYIQHVDSKTITFDHFASVNIYVGNWVRYPVAVILTILGVFIYFRHTSAKFKRTYTMDTLKKFENQNWPQITPVLSLDLVKEDLDTGPWAMAKLPLDFCKEHNMLYVIKDQEDKDAWAVIREKAYETFTLQLGSLWPGVQALPIHMKALFVIFMARAERNRDVAHKLLTQISASAEHGKLDFTGVEELTQKYAKLDIIKWVENRHAYIYTAMATLLEIARADGVLATAEFLWLKPLDRRLWYVLNSVGRQTSVVEVAGPFAQWLAERKLKRPLKAPMMKEAVNALEEDIKNQLYIPEGEKWRTTNAA